MAPSAPELSASLLQRERQSELATSYFKGELQIALSTFIASHSIPNATQEYRLGRLREYLNQSTGASNTDETFATDRTKALDFLAVVCERLGVGACALCMATFDFGDLVKAREDNVDVGNLKIWWDAQESRSPNALELRALVEAPVVREWLGKGRERDAPGPHGYLPSPLNYGCGEPLIRGSRPPSSVGTPSQGMSQQRPQHSTLKPHLHQRTPTFPTNSVVLRPDDHVTVQPAMHLPPQTISKSAPTSTRPLVSTWLALPSKLNFSYRRLNPPSNQPPASFEGMVRMPLLPVEPGNEVIDGLRAQSATRRCRAFKAFDKEGARYLAKGGDKDDS